MNAVVQSEALVWMANAFVLPALKETTARVIEVRCQLNSILFYSIRLLFYSILFYSILFYSILFYSILFYSILFYSILFYSILSLSSFLL